MKNKYLVIGSLTGAAAVAIGAMGAHSLKNILSPENLALIQIGVTYQMYHALLICIVSLTQHVIGPKALTICLLAFLGILFFCGSLYTIAFLKHAGLTTTFVGPITPIGGVFFILSWLLLAYSAVKKS
jgi:uncharacterized membrane protein YgdD (TMEM256/DUF423 family)